MSPLDLEEYGRQNYNAIGDTFYSQSEIFRHIYNAQMELAREANCIRNVNSSTSTVIGTQEYAKPTYALSIKRLTYNGMKLAPITTREDDSLTGNNSTTTAQGTPVYYYEWGASVFLRPVPDSVATLKFFTFDIPQTVTAISTLDVPTRYHHDIAFYIIAMMALKDKNPSLYQVYIGEWNKKVMAAKSSERKILRGDAFSGVQDENTLMSTWIGST